MSSAKTTIFVCTVCRDGENPENRPGEAFFAALKNCLAASGEDIALRIEPVECLAVCKRPCTVALASAGKWTYVIGDLVADEHAEEILAAAKNYAATENGIVPWKDRPPCFKKGVVSRTPALGLDARKD